MNTFSNPAAEIVLLASLLEFPEAYYQAISMGLTPDDFTSEERRRIFRAFCLLDKNGTPLTFEATLSELSKSENKDRLTAELTDLLNPLHMPRKNVDWHVKQLKDKTQRRRLKAACQQAIQSTDDPNEDTTACFGYLNDSLLQLHADSHAYGAQQAAEFVPAVLRSLHERSAEHGTAGLSTGLTKLDEATTGVRPGELWIVGALPGRGKSALAIQMGIENARKGHSVALFSLEMTPDEVGARLLANESGVPASRIRNPKSLTKEQWQDLLNCSSRIEKWPLYCDFSPCLAIQELVARARLCVRRRGCRLIVVDYLRLIQAPGKDLRERVGNVTDGLRQLAKSERVGVIALSQLARPKDRDLNARPSMLELKESGDIEAHAHVVLLTYLPVLKDIPTGLDEIIISKNRHGPIGSIEVTFSRLELKFLPRHDEPNETRSNQNQLRPSMKLPSKVM